MGSRYRGSVTVTAHRHDGTLTEDIWFGETCELDCRAVDLLNHTGGLLVSLSPAAVATERSHVRPGKDA